VRLAAPGSTVERRVTVRPDPRVGATVADMNIWYGVAQKIERTECTLQRAVVDLADVERLLAKPGRRRHRGDPRRAVSGRFSIARRSERSWPRQSPIADELADDPGWQRTYDWDRAVGMVDTFMAGYDLPQVDSLKEA
jgi:hypothetical protein